MASVYICNVTGDGMSPATAFTPAVTPAGAPFAVLMIDERKNKNRALIASSNDALSGPGVSKLLTAATWEDLVAVARSSNPTGGQRNTLNSWLTNAGYTPLTAAQVSWFDCIQYVAQQVNPAADFATVRVA